MPFLPDPLLLKILDHVMHPSAVLMDLKVALGHTQKLPPSRLEILSRRNNPLGFVRHILVHANGNFRAIGFINVSQIGDPTYKNYYIHNENDRDDYDRFFRAAAKWHQGTMFIRKWNVPSQFYANPLTIHYCLRNTISNLYDWWKDIKRFDLTII